jgi:hypothetical protein
MPFAASTQDEANASIPVSVSYVIHSGPSGPHSLYVSKPIRINRKTRSKSSFSLACCPKQLQLINRRAKNASAIKNRVRKPDCKIRNHVKTWQGFSV